MKKLKKLLPLLVVLLFTGCSSLFSKWEVKDEKHTPEQAKVWHISLTDSIQENVLISEWYGTETPIIYLRKTGNMSEKEFAFLDGLAKKDVSEITQEDLERFDELVIKYNQKLRREFFLEPENIKDGRSLVRQMLRDSRDRLDTPGRWIAENVVEPEDWAKIVAMAGQPDLTEKDVKTLVKILNRAMKEDKFFNHNYWLNIEISERTEDLMRLANMNPRTSLIRNNLNAKALFVAYSEYLSAMERWDN